MPPTRLSSFGTQSLTGLPRRTGFTELGDKGWRMSESHAGRDQLSPAEINLLLLLDTAGTTLHRPDGRVQWALDADDVCDLLELAADLLADWGGGPGIGVAAVRARAASLLGTTAEPVGGQGWG
jgi:hypothetical protein